MASPFPGMDPYLEKPGFWPDVHHMLISGCRERLGAQIRPKYLVRIEERTYIADDSDPSIGLQVRIPDVEVLGRPGWEETRISSAVAIAEIEIAEPVVAMTWFEVEIHEAFLKIIDRDSHEVVTVIEILSPSNKVAGSSGRKSFEDNRREVMHSPSHWVEIDLLRGNRVVRIPKRKVGRHEYLVHVSKSDMRPRGLLYPMHLARRLPVIPIPLKTEDPDTGLDMQAVLDAAYDRAGYDLQIDYHKEPDPPLDPELATWADELLKSKGLR
jgi:hypothetical protein